MRWTHDAQVIPAIGSSMSTVAARAAAPPLDGSVGMAACILQGSIPGRTTPRRLVRGSGQSMLRLSWSSARV